MARVFFACTPAPQQMGALAIAGDSITAGYGLADPATQSWGAQLAPLLAARSCANGGHAGEYATNMVTRYPADIAPAYSKIGHPVAILEIGTNDIASGLYTLAQTKGYVEAWGALAKAQGWLFGLCTVLDRTAILTVSKATFDANRALFNDYVRTVAPCDFYVDFDTDSRLLLASNTTYYQDGVHPTAAGAAVMAAVGNVAVRGFMDTAT